MAKKSSLGACQRSVRWSRRYFPLCSLPFCSQFYSQFRSLSFLFFFSFVATTPALSKVTRLTKLVADQETSTSHSVQVVRVSDGKTLFSYGEHALLIPASVTKLVMTAAALDHWGPAHQFKTGFYHSGRRAGGTIYGDLIVKGDGDPFFVSEKLWAAAADLKNMGISQINGSVLSDHSLFGDPARDASRAFGKKASRNAYDAPVTAAGINFNTYEIMVSPSTKIGAKATVRLSPYSLPSVQIVNKTTTVKGSKISVKVTRTSKSGGLSVVTVTGTAGQGASPKKVYRSVGDPYVTSAEITRSFLQKEGITVRSSGKPAQQKTPLAKDARLLLQVDSYPLYKSLRGLNVYSNNYIADVLVKRMGASLRGDGAGSGTYQAGLEAISAYVKKLGVGDTPSRGFVIENASGLSTENRLSSYVLTKLLVSMTESLEVFPEFLSSLPTSGVDGTLEKRFQSPLSKHLKGQVRAKTGTLTSPVSVSSLAGYVRHPKHGLLAFSIIQNGKKGKKQPPVADLRLWQERFLVALLGS